MGGEGASWFRIEMEMKITVKREMQTRNATGDAGERHSGCVGLSAWEEIARLIMSPEDPIAVDARHDQTTPGTRDNHTDRKRERE